MLVRHYIHQRLKEYYAQSAASVVGGLNDNDGPAIAFRSLWGEWQWNNVYAKLYAAQQGQWLTPSELFQPYYSQCLAEWVASRIVLANTMASSTSSSSARQKVRLMELGGGRGTNALCLLDHLERHYPQLYHDHIDEYVLIDSSESLLALQQEPTNMTRHFAKMTHRLCDLQDVAEGRDSLFLDDDCDDHDDPTTTTIVLALEVLDNLPHDRLVLRRPSRRNNGGVDHNKWSQLDLVESTAAGTTAGRRYQEIERPLTDPLLQRCLALTTNTRTPQTPSSSWLSTVAVDNNNNSAVCWYPTIAIGVLDHLLSQPHHHHVELLMADFDMLPDVDGGGNHHPLITDMDKVDYHHYLQPPASPTDILFATDFELLARVCRNHPSSSSSSSSSTRDDDDEHDDVITATVSKQGDFLKRYPHIVRQTRSRFGWFSPMVDSFSNCSILTVERTRRTTTITSR